MPLQHATSPAVVPAQPGTYVLVLRMSRATTLRVGRLGEFDFPCGLYLYVGSAQGAGGLRARLMRHWRAHKPLRWHVDYLREVAAPVGVWWQAGRARCECAWAQAIGASPSAQLIVPRFGASDCPCATHLWYVELARTGIQSLNTAASNAA